MSRPPCRLRVELLEDRRLLAITVNTLVDEADGSILDGDVSLRDAIAAAPLNEAINFAASLTSGGPATLQLGQLAQLGTLSIGKSLTIQGPGVHLLTIKAPPRLPQTDGFRVFVIDDGNANVDAKSLSQA